MRKLLLLSVIILWSGAVFAEPEIKGTPQELKAFLYPTDKVVTINAQAEQTAYSDKAIVSLVITTEAGRLAVAISKNSELRQDITKSLIDSGVAAGSIRSSTFSSSPQYGWFGKKPSSYRVVNRMAVSIENERLLKDIAEVADKNDEVELSDTSFEHTKKDEFNSKVKADALAKIIKQKEFYENSLGVKLTTIGVRDASTAQRATRGALMLEEVVVNAAKPQQDSFSSASKYRGQNRGSSFDEVRYEANLVVDFKIEP